MKSASRKKLNEVVELDITAFMNLMVILIPFLLITAVFSRMTVIEINLPALDAAQAQSDKPLDLSLELVIRDQQFVIQDQNLGQLYSINRDTDHQWQALTRALIEIKNRYPQEDDMLLLLESDVPYKTLIKVMDHVKSAEDVQVAQVVTIALFGNVSISDAPALDISSDTEVNHE